MASQVLLVDGTVQSLDQLTLEGVHKWVGWTPTFQSIRDGQALIYDDFGATNKLPWNPSIRERWDLNLRGNVILTTLAELAPLEEELV